MKFDNSLSEKLKSLDLNFENMNLFAEFVNESKGKEIVCFKGYGDGKIRWERDISGVISGEVDISCFGRNMGLVVPVTAQSHLFYFNGKVLPVSGLNAPSDNRDEGYGYLVGRANLGEIYIDSSYFDKDFSNFSRNNGRFEIIHRNRVFKEGDLLKLPQFRGIVVE